MNTHGVVFAIGTVLAMLSMLFGGGCLSVTDSQFERLLATPAASNLLAKVEARLDAEIAKEEARLGIAAAAADSSVPSVPSSPSAAEVPIAPGVEFSDLRWTFGGFDGSRAVESEPKISALQLSANSLQIKWDVGLASWGLANTEPGALACLFVRRADGAWAGGKFEWISTSRRSRSFKNLFEGYGGWSLSDVPNPCRAAFLVVSADGRRRTNILEGEWNR